MNTHKKQRRKECLGHRQAQYEKALDGVIEGKLPASYVTKRWKKLKQIKEK